ncbi:MAG: DNA mismatch repair endonuclease MutL [Ignavibacteria bacterium]|nr:DNA mismatch repair endonuclease MutL [Ignavibacteria bacterium]
MPKIKILPENLSNKIAAGEVVQRPESVVKELLENSIDANSTEIKLLIKRAGKVLIQVVDNGDGMAEEDAILCILKHATSKIITDSDLEAIKTLGFRGEALSSITAVSQVELRTQTDESEIGVQLRIDDGQHIEKEFGSFAKGTSVSVKNLFFNTPARRNFLRTDTTETKHIIETFNRIALSHPKISFKLFIDDEITLDFPSGELTDRIGNVFGEGILSALINVEERTEFLSLYGFIGKPSLLKKSKGDQYLFLNNRYVVSRQINHAVFTAYENVLEKGDYPFFILFLEIDPHRIDINVHPSKLEVRFDDEKDIYSFVVSVLRKSLSSYDLVPNLTFTQGASEKERMTITPFQKSERSDFSDRPSKPNYNSKSQSFNDKDIDMLFGSLSLNVNRESPESNIKTPFENENVVDETIQKSVPIRASSEEKENSSFIIQLHHKYILSQIKSGLMIIDQHAAHERILYEKALKLFDINLPFAQPLLFPKTIEVDASKLLMLKELHPYLLKLGFEIKFFGQNTIIIEAVPQDIHPGNEEEILLEILDEYLINRREKKILEVKDNMAKSFSCKSAIKTGDKLSELEMRVLIDQLFATSMPYVCPHGRPIVVKISLDEFDRRFGRT